MIGPTQLCASRDEPLRRCLPWLRSYEVSQLSMLAFVIGFITALRTGLPSLIAAVCLTLIPACRVCPELPLLRTWPRGRMSKGILVILRCCILLWLVFVILFWCKRQWRSTTSTSISRPHKEDARPPSPVEVFEVEEPSWETIVEDSATSWPQQTSPCFFLESKYEPLNMPGYGRTRVRSPEQCQARCSKARGCAYFTAFQIQPDLYWCHLQEYRSHLARADRAIAGPGDCNQEAILLEAMGQRIPAPTTTQAPKRAPPVSPPAPRPPMARASRPKVEQQPAPAPLAPPAPPLIVKEPQTAAPDKEQEAVEVELAVPDVGADGSLTILLIVLVAAGAVSFSGRVERS